MELHKNKPSPEQTLHHESFVDEARIRCFLLLNFQNETNCRFFDIVSTFLHLGLQFLLDLAPHIQ